MLSIISECLSCFYALIMAITSKMLIDVEFIVRIQFNQGNWIILYVKEDFEGTKYWYSDETISHIILFLI